MKKKGILSLLIVFSVLISCGFRLIACADEAALPEEASVAVVEEAPVAVSPQQAADAASAQQAVEAAPVQPAMESAPTQSAMESAPTQSAMEAAPAQPVMEAAPAQSTTASPVSNPAPEPVSNSAPVQSATKPASNSEPEPAVTPAADSSSEPVSAPVADSSSDHTTESTAESAETPAASNSSESDTKPANSLIEQADIQAAETVEPVTGTGMHAAESGMHAADDNAGTYSITLRNRVYVDTRVDLAATFYLSILREYIPNGLNLEWFRELFTEDGLYWTGLILLQDNETRSLQGIPSICPVIVNSINPEEDDYTDEAGKHDFSTSYIVDNTCTPDLPGELNGGQNCTGDIEFTFLRFPEQEGKKLFVINDSDINEGDPLELELTVQVTGKCVFEYSAGSSGEKKTITLNPGETTIKLMPGEYGFVFPESGDLSDVKIIKTPTNVDVTKGVSSVGDYDETNHEMTISTENLGSLVVNPAIYSLFRAEEPKTDLGTPKTDDGDPGTDPGSDPGNPDPENDPGNPNPEPTPGNDPGTPDPGNNTENNTPVTNHKTSSPIKNKKSSDTDQPSADTSVSQKTPSVGTSSPQTEAVDTADRTPIAMYVLFMLAALVVAAAAIMISAVRSRRQFRR